LGIKTSLKMKLKILIIGSSGQIGGALLDVLSKNKAFKVVGADKISSKGTPFLDITKKRGVNRFFKKIKPQVIILLAAFTNVDACEDRRTFAYNTNVKGVNNVVQAAKRNLAKLIYISTAYVFDGKRGDYKEDDKPHPINFYAKTKLEAERIIQKELKDYLIIRTNWIFDLGYDQKNFVIRLLNTLKKKESLKVPNNQYGNPTLARNIAWVLEELIRKNKKGIYHIAGRDKMSKYQWAIRVAKHFNLDHKLIIPVSSKTLKQKARRPKKDDLNLTKAKKELNTKLLSLKEALVLLNQRIKL